MSHGFEASSLGVVVDTFCSGSRVSDLGSKLRPCGAELDLQGSLLVPELCVLQNEPQEANL